MKEELYLVTGASGFLGSAIVRLLIDRGKRVRVFVLPNDAGSSHIPSGAKRFVGNLLDRTSVAEFFNYDSSRFDAVVIHAASIITLDPAWNETVKSVNVDGTAHFIAECLAHHV
jgi:dihydroflavonol-4-reductase